jgi:signal transduction histidine kinase
MFRKLRLSAVSTPFFLLILSATLTLAYFSFVRKIDSFSQVDFNARYSRGEIEIVTPPEELRRNASELHPRDRVILIDGQPVASIAEPVRTLSRAPFPHVLTVLRGGNVVSARLGEPPTRIDFVYLFLVFTGILYLFIGLATLARDRSSPAFLFAGFCLSAFAINVLTTAGPVDALWKAAWLSEDFFRALAPALLLHFFLRFPKRLRFPAGAIYALPLVYLVGEILLSLPSPPVSAARIPFAVELLERVWVAYFAAYGAASLALVVSAARNSSDVAIQRQARWIALGVGFGLSPFILVYLVPRAFGFSAPWAAFAGIIPLVFVPLGFAYAILRWRLWDIDIFAREAAATTAAVFLGAASFVLVNTLLNRTLADFAPGARNFLSFGSGLFLASLLVPVKRRLSDAIERFQYGETYRARRALLDFSRQWRGVKDAESIAAALADGIAEALSLSRCRLFLFGGVFPPGISEEALAERLSSEESVRIRSLTFPSGEDLTFLRLSEDGYRYLFPLRSAGRLAGVLAVGLKEGRVPLSTEDRALLSTVLSQAALAFENAELYHTLERQMGEMAEKEKLASLGVLAAGVAHEVNTPLAGISSYAQMLLADTDKSDPRYEILKKMERQTFRASRLVGNLLEFTRGRHGARERIDLSKVMAGALEAAETALAARRLKVECAGFERPVPVVGNARELEQVFVNLLVNARDASIEGARIEVRLERNNSRVVVEVADSGKGLSEEEARRAFEPFFTTRSSGGTGLGLSIAREIVERHGGEIRLAARPEGGVVASVSLPGGD